MNADERGPMPARVCRKSRGERGIALALALLLSGPAAADTIRVASWNLFNLHHLSGRPLRSGAPARSDADYATLRKYADLLAADIVALQEIDGPRAAARVFPGDRYDVYVSGRYARDGASGADSDRIYTGFAVRRGVFDAVRKTDVPELSVLTGRDRRPTRWGTELLVEKGGAVLRLLAVHLKSGCSGGSLERPSSESCETLARQREPLERWIDRAAAGPVPFVVLGDFNRRFDVHGPRDHLWREIDDGSPPGLDLFRYPFRQRSRCWQGTANHHDQSIDFIVVDERAEALLVRGSFREIDYRPDDRDVTRKLPSDHCPIAVDLRF